MSDRIVIPEYPIPKELEKVLDKNLKEYPDMSETSQKYLKVLQKLQKVGSLDISKDDYLQLLKLALYLEEYQNNKEMKKHEMFNKTIQHQDNPISIMNTKLPIFHITVDDLDEEKTWIKPNDFVDVIDVKTKRLYTLRVTNVTQTHIVAHDDDECLHSAHKPEKRYDIKFRAWNYALRCAHYALTLMDRENTVKYLFPSRESEFYVENENKDDSTFQFKARNWNIANNAEQRQAVSNIVNKSSFPAPYILYGPPGTGKTATLVEALCQIRNRNHKGHVLVCTPSNTAADEITRRLLMFLPTYAIYRLYSQSKDVATIDERIQRCSNVEDKKIILPTYGDTIDERIQRCSNVEDKKIILPTYGDISGKRIVITTLCNAIRLIIMKVPHDHFSHVFIDEAGQGTESDILIPISLVSDEEKLHSQIVFAGDPQQLGPTVISKLAEKILGRSILERLMSYDLYQKDDKNKYNPKYITKLLENYRSHPDIIHVSNKLFYENELIAKCPRGIGRCLCPIIFHGIAGKEEKFSYSPSVCNWKEVRLVVDYVEKLLWGRLGFGGVRVNDIGIVTPFTLQSKKIKKALKDRHLSGINVGTVELFQGQEKNIMIMSTVRNKTFVFDGKEHIGHLSNAKRFNVAMTRAKRLLIIVGNPNVLQVDENWRYLLKFCIDNKSYRGLDFCLNRFNDKKNDNSSSLVKSSVLFKEQPLSLLNKGEIPNLDDLLSDLHIF